MDHDASLYYALAVSLALYLAPWLCAGAAAVLIQRAMAAEKKKERKAARGHNSNNYNRLSTHTAVFFANAHLWNELRYGSIYSERKFVNNTTEMIL